MQVVPLLCEQCRVFERHMHFTRPTRPPTIIGRRIADETNHKATKITKPTAQKRVLTLLVRRPHTVHAATGARPVVHPLPLSSGLSADCSLSLCALCDLVVLFRLSPLSAPLFALTAVPGMVTQSDSPIFDAQSVEQGAR